MLVLLALEGLHDHLHLVGDAAREPCAVGVAGADDRHRQIAGGGGGYGDPYLRPAEQVIREVRNGTLSLQKAQEDYGIVIDPKTLNLDESRTERLRR